MDVPRCPITGEPARRHIQDVGVKMLRSLWRYTAGGDPGHLFAGIKRFRLWESPCGLAFFDPPIAGDREFYRQFYHKIGAHDRLAGPTGIRPEMSIAGEQARPGDSVLDVGAGEGGFRRFLPEGVRYVGLDPSFAEDAPEDRDVRADTIEQHAATHAGRYDVAVALQVIEHVPDPVGFTRLIADCVRPGGLVILGVPGWPCDMTDIPNFAPNAPPHHLSWWNEGALRALAARLGLVAEQVIHVDVASDTGLLCWMARLSPRRTEERYFKAAWSWHFALIFSWLGGKVMDRLFGVPKGAKPREWLLIARKPG